MTREDDDEELSDDDRDDPFGKWAHDNNGPPHSGEDGHYCNSWDGLWICKDCGEYEFCECQ